MSSCLILLNPHAAGGRAAKLAPLFEAWLQARQVKGQSPPRLVCSHGVAHARGLIDALPRQSRVLIVGGDGSVNQMLPSILAGQHSLGIVPFGSGNDTARALGLLGMKPLDALTFALQGQTQKVDIGLIQTNSTPTPLPFISSLTAGFDGAVALRAHASPKWLIGLPRYLYATAREIYTLKRNDVQLTVDDTLHPRATVLFSSVLNTASYGSGMPAVPHAKVNDGALNLLVAGEFGRAGVLAMLPKLLIGKHLSHPCVSTYVFKSLQIDSSTALPLTADGEPVLAATQVKVSVVPLAIEIVTKLIA